MRRKVSCKSCRSEGSRTGWSGWLTSKGRRVTATRTRRRKSAAAYHYVTRILAAREQAPFTLVLVDNHPDDQAPAFGGVLSCGSWVRDLREACPMLEEVWTLGPDHRIRNASGTVDRELDAGIDDLLEAVEGKRVYLSIDKDVLGREWSRTDWSQGTYSPAQLKGWLDGLLKQELVAVDLCGELSPEKGATPEDLRVNCELNVELQEFILSYLKR